MLTNSLRLKRRNKNQNICYTPIQKKNSQDLSNSSKSLSINDLLTYSPLGRNKRKTMITSLLSSSKGILRNKKQYSSSTNFPKQFKHFYPFKPDTSLNLLNFSNNEEKTKLILSPRYNEPKRNINEYNSSKKFLSFRPMSNYQINLKSNLDLRKHHLYINRDSIHDKSPMVNFYNIKNKNMVKENEKNNSIENKRNIEEYLDENKFMNFIDEINKNNNYLHKCKNNIKKYFETDKKNNGNKSFFEELLYKYNFDEHRNEKYFSSDKYSTKKNSFELGNLKISFKITSLKFIFYEIMENANNIDNKIFYNIENNNKIKYKINSKIKFPFEFLSIFYGIELSEFINLILSIIEYDKQNKKFTINHNNFISKIEMGKTLYDFFTDISYFSLYNYNKGKECLIYDWDIKNINNVIKHYAIKILLPQMKISIKSNNMKKVKFFSNISIKTMGDLINKSFNMWDYYILIYFSEFKLFRFEMNKILCGKYIINNDNKKNEFNKILFNLNHLNIILNTIKKNDSSYGFFYSNIKINKIESYYINLKLPKIQVSYQNPLYSFSKKFDIDIKRLSQINKLRKSFRPEDLIKYSMIIIKNKNKDVEVAKNRHNNKLLSSKTLFSSVKRANSTIIRQKTRNNSKRSNHSNSSNKNNNMKKEIQGKIKFTKNFNHKEEVIRDIKLNLDKYIFNFDESILKYIKVENNKFNNLNKRIFNKDRDMKKNYFSNHNILRNNTKNFTKMNNDEINNDKKFDIEIGTLELSWTNQDALTKNLFLNKKDSEYLLEYPPFQWKFFVEKNVEEILSNEANILKPISLSSKKALISRIL